MDSTNVNRIKNTQASFTGKVQENLKETKTQEQQKTKDTQSIKQDIKAREENKKTEEQLKQEQLKQDQIQRTQTSRLNLIRNKQLQQKQDNPQLYKQELQNLKGVLRNWVNGILNPSSNFHLQQTKADENATQRFLNSWLNSDSKAIQNLERLLNLQLQLQPNNTEIYVKLQLVKLVKDAKKMVEEHATNNDPKHLPKGEEEANQHSILTAGMMATAANKLKRKKNKSYTDIREELKKELKELNINEQKSYYENITRARKLLKDAERELFEAIKNGADQETVNSIIEKITDIYSLLSEIYTR